MPRFAVDVLQDEGERLEPERLVAPARVRVLFLEGGERANRLWPSTRLQVDPAEKIPRLVGGELFGITPFDLPHLTAGDFVLIGSQRPSRLEQQYLRGDAGLSRAGELELRLGLLFPAERKEDRRSNEGTPALGDDSDHQLLPLHSGQLFEGPGRFTD